MIQSEHRWTIQDDGTLGGLCRRSRNKVLVPDHPVPQASGGHPLQNRMLEADVGTDLEEGSTNGVMDHLNWGYIQLGLIALAFGGLQVGWTSNLFRRRDLARPLSERGLCK